ncbi:MAG: Hsp20/alpha crystallin family protein [Leptospiraceae bacterium]|nr:Hsp20/alpha crystallin family protein [Leptospiraceae bacterium]
MILNLTRNPFWNEVNRLQEELENSFWQVGSSKFYSYPSVNVYSGENEAIVHALVPGYSPEDLEITIEGSVLKLKSTKKEDSGNEWEVVKKEFIDRSFEREFELSFKIDLEKVQANFKNGILTIVLPKQESEKPKKIQIAVN